MSWACGPPLDEVETHLAQATLTASRTAIR